MPRRSACLAAWILGLATFLAGGVPARAQAGPARLVKDINTTPTSASGSSPSGFVEFQGLAFFTAHSLETGRELWRSDGTEEGTVLVQDLAPGPSSGRPQGITLAESRLFFTADDVVHGRELWAGRAAILARRPDRALQDLGDEVLGLGLSSGIERSLIAKLRAAQAALDRREGAPPRSACWTRSSFRWKP